MQNPKNKQHYQILAKFLTNLPLSFEKTISIALLRHPTQTKKHDFRLLLRDENTKRFIHHRKEVESIVTVWKERLKQIADLSLEPVQYKNKVWLCINIDLMPEIKEKWEKLKEKATHA